jgi:protein tyrosine/serine phosphatase
MTRILELQGVANFRDYGDYATAAGVRIRPGRLYRSAHHGRATPADLEAIGKLDIAVVVDLRRAVERNREPSRRPAGFDGLVIQTDLGETGDDPWWTFVRDSDLSEAAFREYMTGYYREAPFEPRHIELFSRYFAALADTSGAVLIHCAAGKDRTGILAALTHHLVGVHAEDILEDYLLTNQAISFEKRLPLMMQAIASNAGREPSPAAVRVAMGVEEGFLAGALGAIGAAYGGVEGYARDALGVDAAMRARIEARLLA